MSWQQGVCCNLCGKELDMFDIQNDFTIQKDAVCYGSGLDGERVELRLCCSCFDRIAYACEISPVRGEESP